MSHEPTENLPDWTPLFRAFSEAFEWALDLAGGLASAYPEEVACVERVRGFTRKRIAGDPAHIRLDDLLFTFGLLAGALERDVRPALTPRVVAAARTKPALKISHRKPALARRTAHAVRATTVASRPRSALSIARERWAA